MIYKSRIVPFWLCKETLGPIFLSFLTLTSLVFFQQISRNSEALLSSLIGWKAVGQILLSLIPSIVTFTLPVAILIGEIIAISKLVSDCEWVAIEAGTLSSLLRVSPFIFLGAIGSVVILWLNWSIAPSLMVKLKDLRTVLTSNKTSHLITPQTFISQFPNHLIRVNAVDPLSGKWKGVILLRKEKKTEEIQLLAAQSGSITPLDNNFETFEVKLTNGVYIKNLLSANDHVTSTFKENTLKVSPERSPVSTVYKETETKESAQLLSMSSLLKISLLPSSKNNQFAEYELEICKRVANALGAIFSALCAVSLTAHIRPRQTNKRPLLLILGFILMVTFYASLLLGQDVSLKGLVQPKWAILIACAVPFLLLYLFNLALKNDLGSRLPYIKNKSRYYRIKQFNQIQIGKDTQRQTAKEDLPSLNLGLYLILSAVTQFLLVATTLLTATVLLFTMLDIAPSITRNHIKIGFALVYLAKLSPQIFYYIIPFGILIAITASATALARTGQLTIIIFYATHPFRLVFPVILMVLTVSIFAFFLSDSILPFTNRDQDNRYKQIKGRALEDVIVAFDRQWISDEESSLLYGYRLSNSNNQINLNELIIQLSNPRYYLSKITYLDGVRLTTRDGQLVSQQDDSNIFQYEIGLDGLVQMQKLSSRDIPTSIFNPRLFEDKNYREASKMTLQQLKTYIKQVEKIGLPSVGLKMELAQKYSFPFSCITLMCLAFPLCLIQLQRQHQSRFSAILISLSLALVFWAILSVFEAAGKRGTIPIFLAAWSPHVLFLALAATIQLKLHFR